MFTLHRRMGG